MARPSFDDSVFKNVSGAKCGHQTGFSKLVFQNWFDLRGEVSRVLTGKAECEILLRTG